MDERRLGRSITLPSRRRLLIGLLLAALTVVVTLHLLDTSPVIATVAIGGQPFFSLTVDEQTGRAFVFNRLDDTTSVLDTRTGVLLRTVNVGASFAWFAVARRTAHVFLSSGGDGTISMLDAHTGAVLRTSTDNADLTTRWLAVDERSNHVFVGHRDSATVTMLDAQSGAILGQLNVCSGPFAVGVSGRTGHLFAKCNDGTTDMLDARTGRVLRTNPLNSGTYCGIVTDEAANRVFETGNGVTDILDAQTGVRLTGLPAINPTDCVKGMDVDNRTGRVYASLGGPGGPGPVSRSEVVVLDGRTGTLLRRITVAENPVSLAVDSQTGHVLVGSTGKLDASGVPVGLGTLSVLDGASGRLLRTLPVGTDPSDIAIDGMARRALVVNSNSDVNGNGLPGPRLAEGWWTQRARWLKHWLAWMPLPLPPPPGTNGTVTTLDLTRL